MCSGQERGGELAQSGVEAQRQRREDHVVRGVAEVTGDAPRAREQVAVAQHDALRPSGAAGRVEDARDLRRHRDRRGVHLARPGVPRPGPRSATWAPKRSACAPARTW